MQIDYTIGDDIVCIKTHSQGVVIEGNVYKCKALKGGKCNCKDKYLVDIGGKSVSDYSNCRICGTRYEDADGVFWINASMFRKLDTLVNIDEIHELLNEPIEA